MVLEGKSLDRRTLRLASFGNVHAKPGDSGIMWDAAGQIFRVGEWKDGAMVKDITSTSAP